jgi:hypothetical protein
MVEFFSHADNITLAEDAKERLDRIHKDKIRVSDAIFVVNPGGYVGDSTRQEIELAYQLHKQIMWLETPEAEMWTQDGHLVYTSSVIA